MTRRDRYCFKEGKLELSLLDEMIDEYTDGNSDGADDEQDANSHIKGFPPLQETPLIISEEIYNTLKTMGEFLTQPEEIEIKESIELQENIETNQYINRGAYIHKETTLKQTGIDELLLSHFGELHPRFKYAEDLKKKIDAGIKKIKSNK